MDNASGMIRIVDKNSQVDFGEPSSERIVNVHIMEPSTKSDCMLANKPNDINQRLHDTPYSNCDKTRVIIQQNTVIQSGNSQNQNLTKDQEQTENSEQQTKVGSSLPILTDDQESAEELKRTVLQECKREVVDKNCSPINMEEIEALKEDKDFPSNNVQRTGDNIPQKSGDNELFEFNLGCMPIIEPLADNKIEEKPAKANDTIENDEAIKKAEDVHDTDVSSKSGSPSPKTDEEKIVESIKQSESKDSKEVIITEDNKESDVNVEKDSEKNNENIDKAEQKNDFNTFVTQSKDEAQCNEKNSKRSKRIFSVDDIINNIGQSKKSKRETERRHSLHSVMEFLDKELNNTFMFDAKEKEMDLKSNSIENSSKSSDCKPKMIINEDNASAEVEDTNENLSTDIVPEMNKSEIEDTDGKNNEKVTNDSKIDNLPSLEKNSLKKICLDESLQSSQDLQFRNVIKVEESNVWLHIAGELVEINVSNVNGKKVISVTPMSSSTLVDFNDNYEALDSNDVPEMLKFDEPEIQNEEAQELEIESVVPEVDCVEPSSEVIIGMDLTLEEEIKLDVAQPQVLCTKAAKKAYDNDLQIPSITTSEDVNNKSDDYSNNDKVSSTKEKSLKDSSEELEDLKSSKTDREKLREFRKIRSHPKEENHVSVEDEDDFVPFKELIKARKEKKLKMMEMKKTDEIMKADSTNKEDEIVKETPVDNKSNKNKDKKETVSKSTPENKKHKTSNSSSKSNNSTRDKSKNEKRNKDRHHSSEKKVKDKPKSNKKKELPKPSDQGK